MKKSTLSIACALALATVAAPTMAEVALSANVAMTTDYVWRGMTQNDEEAAIQGGFDAGLDNGLYAGIWGSNVNTGEGSMEIDYYVGWATELNSGVGVDVGVVAYTYPGTNDWDTEEYYLGASFANYGGKLSYNNDFDTYYWEVSADFELPNEFGLGLHYGYWDMDGGDQADWKLGVTKTLAAIDFELAYTDTDRSDSKDWADGRVFLTVSKGWE